MLQLAVLCVFLSDMHANFSYFIEVFRMLIYFSKLRKACHIEEEHFNFVMICKLLIINMLSGRGSVD